MSKIVFFELAWEQYMFWQNQDKKFIKKMNKLLADIDRNGNQGIGHPEPLKGGRDITWSRHITAHDRIIYEINDDEILVLVIDVEGHYNDK